MREEVEKPEVPADDLTNWRRVYLYVALSLAVACLLMYAFTQWLK